MKFIRRAAAGTATGLAVVLLATTPLSACGLEIDRWDLTAMAECGFAPSAERSRRSLAASAFTPDGWLQVQAVVDEHVAGGDERIELRVRLDGEEIAIGVGEVAVASDLRSASVQAHSVDHSFGLDIELRGGALASVDTAFCVDGPRDVLRKSASLSGRVTTRKADGTTTSHSVATDRAQISGVAA